MSIRHPGPAGPGPAGSDATDSGYELRDRLVGFLTDRLTEELRRIWERQAPGAQADSLASRVAAVDDVLTPLQAGLLPGRGELRMLLYGYGAHPDYDPAFTDLLLD